MASDVRDHSTGIRSRNRSPDVDDGGISRDATATENTPLLLSETASSHTLGETIPADAAPDPGAADVPRRPGTHAEGDDANGVDESIGPGRALCIILSMWALIFLQGAPYRRLWGSVILSRHLRDLRNLSTIRSRGTNPLINHGIASNMSGMTMAQSTIAADLDAYENAMWFTSAYLITTASLAPVVGRLSTIFSPGIMILVSAFFFALGAIVTSQARSFAVFILGRVLIGTGGAGIMTLSLILVLQLAGKKRRGLFIGLTNCGFTIGLSTGAVVFGGLLKPLGWVCRSLTPFRRLRWTLPPPADTLPTAGSFLGPGTHWHTCRPGGLP